MYRSPFTCEAYKTTVFKKKGNWKAGYHTGEDWISKGSYTLVAPCSGTVSTVSSSGSYGEHIVIKTAAQCVLMAHMKAGSVKVKEGQKVVAGDEVGIIGSTGNSTGDHLHIEVQNAPEWTYNKNLLEPSKYIDFSNYNEVFKMKKGDKSAEVFAFKLILIMLKKCGKIKKGVDGNDVYGAGTVEAVKQVQKTAALSQTGEADAVTVKAAAEMLAGALK